MTVRLRSCWLGKLAEAGEAVATASDQGPESDAEAAGTGEPRKRRRRRKPRGGAESATGGSD